MTVPPAGTQHLSEEILAAWLDRGLSDPDRERAEAHLVSCDACRTLVIEVGGVIGTHRRPRWIPRLALGGVAAAAAVVLLVLLPDPAVTPSGLPVTRTNGTHPVGEDLLRFATQSPDNRATIRPDTTILRWDSIAEGTTYRVTVSSERGDIVLREETRAASQPLAAIASSLVSGAVYYWVVEAQLPNLRVARTAQLGFRVAPR